jgi:hypothetical protein
MPVRVGSSEGLGVTGGIAVVVDLECACDYCGAQPCDRASLVTEEPPNSQRYCGKNRHCQPGRYLRILASALNLVDEVERVSQSRTDGRTSNGSDDCERSGNFAHEAQNVEFQSRRAKRV